MPGLPPPPMSLDDRLANSAYGYGRERLYSQKLSTKDIDAAKAAAQELLDKTLIQGVQDLNPIFKRAQEVGMPEGVIKKWHDEGAEAEAGLRQKFTALTTELVELEKTIIKDEVPKEAETKNKNPVTL